MTSVVGFRPRPAAVPREPWLVAGLAGALVATLGARPLLLVMAAGLTIASGLVWIIAHRPLLAARMMLIIGPLLVGMERGGAFGPLRGNEALLLVACVGVGLAWLGGTAHFPKWHSADTAIAALMVAGVALPLALAFGRGRGPTVDDVLSAFTLVKGGVLYLLFRMVHTRRSEVMRTLHVSLTVASVLAVLAVLDARNLFGFADVIEGFVPSDGGQLAGDRRASVTVGNPIGFGGYLVVHLAIAVAMVISRPRRSPRAVLVLALIGIGVVATGQISAWLAALAMVAVLFVLVRPAIRPRPLMGLVAMGGLVMFFLVPVFEARLQGFAPQAVETSKLDAIASIEPRQRQPLERYYAAPGSSWDVRWYNLETYFLPDLADPMNVILGVQPEGRAEAIEPWLEYVWIESGILWLVYVGGVPLVAAFSFLLYRFGSLGWRRWHREGDTVGLAQVGVLVALGVLMLFDPHLTIRGTSDVLTPVLALGVLGRGPG